MNIKPKLSPRPNELIPEVSAQPVWRNIASQHSPTMRIKPIMQSTGKRLRSSTENKTVLPGGSRKLYISARKVIELWIETRAVTSWVTPTTTFLMRQLIVASRLGRTEYQLLLMKISWWDRSVKIRYKCLVVIDEFLTVLSCLCLLGLSAAFDTIASYSLFTLVSVSMALSYLLSRCFCVRCNNTLSLYTSSVVFPKAAFSVLCFSSCTLPLLVLSAPPFPQPPPSCRWHPTVFMAALRSRCGHYIFATWFVSFCLFFYSSLNLSGRRLDVYHTSTHGVALV